MYPHLPPRKALFLFCILVLLTFIDARAQRAASIIDKPAQYTPGGILDTVFDLQGKKYTLGQIAIDQKTRSVAERRTMPEAMPASCSSGYFQLYLQPGCGMDGSDPVSIARLNVLCRVCYDISNLINSPCASTGQKVNIWVKAGLSGSALGVATPFFYMPSSTTASGIVDNTIWITLNSGRDAFTNVASPLSTSGGGSSGSTFFHGSIAFNFSGSVKWHTNLSTSPLLDTTDLYTVALHEMLHAMGFSSVIDYNGNSVFGPSWKYFSRYDTHLQTPGGTHILISPTPGCSMYGQVVDPALSPIANYFSPGGPGVCPAGYQTGSAVDHSICSHKLEYAGSWPVNMPVYTPECFVKGSSLSHFEDECFVPSGFPLGTAGPATNNQYFLMSNAGVTGTYSATTNPGSMKRYPKPEERQVLCDIGYSVNTSFGDAANLNYVMYPGGLCPGLGVGGVNDGITIGGTFTYTTNTTPININPSSAPIMANDIGVVGGSFKCLEVVFGAGSVSPATGSFSTPIVFTPGSASGVQLLRYIPVSSTGVEGNITYIYVYVSDWDSCISSSCNMVSNGSFENVTPSAIGALTGLKCWGYFAETPDLHKNGCTGPWCHPSSSGDHPFAPANNHFLGVFGGWNVSTSTHVSEGFQGQLSSSPIPYTSYVVSFWARLSNAGGMVTDPTHVQFAVGTWPLIGYSSWLTGSPTGVTLLADFIVTQPDTIWHYYSKTVTYTGPYGTALAVYPAPWVDPITTPRYLHFDEICIRPLSDVCTFHMPDTINDCHAMIDLDTTVSIPGGVFSWKADSAGYVITSHSHIFDPLSAFNASVHSGNNGYVTVCYSYTNASGCTQYVCEEVKLNFGAPIVGVPFMCIGSSASLSNSVPGGVWSSSTISVATIAPSGWYTGVGAGTAAITYMPPSGCYVTKLVTVDIMPPPIMPSTPTVLCGTASLLHTNSAAGGTWSSSMSSTLYVYPTGHTLAGSSGATGTASIYYTFAPGCAAVKTMTVNPVMPPIIPAPVNICIGNSVTLSSAIAGGTWSSSSSWVGAVDAVTGVLTGAVSGTTTISYRVAGCSQSTIATVSPVPTPIVGPAVASICSGTAMTLSDAYWGGAWSCSDISIATVGTTGVVNGISGGICTITYTLPGGCFVTKAVTINALPLISGTLTLCKGDTSTLATSISGGTWLSGDATVAPIGSSSGVVIGATPGTAIISYTSPEGCNVSAVVTVAITPAPISGPSLVGTGATISLSNITSGGTWSGSDPTIATVGSSSGIVTGVSSGTVTITYTLPSGCKETIVITVKKLAGVENIGEGASLSLIPNPNKGTFILSGELSGDRAAIVITDVVGRTVLQDHGTVSGGKLNKEIAIPESFPMGQYFVKVQTENSSYVMRFTLLR